MTFIYPPRCQLEACDRPVKARELCARHYQQLRVQGKPACKASGCQWPAKARGMCGHHYNKWRKKYYTPQACDFKGCKNSLVDRRGRRGWNARYRKLCREHEHLHLISGHKDPEQNHLVERENRERLARGITVQGTCWVYSGPTGDGPGPVGSGKYPWMKTYLSANVDWLAHRVAWGLLMGGHKQRQELDHLSGCEVRAGCVNPCHLQPVSRAENGRRRAHRNAVARGEEQLTVARTGPWFNRDAINSPKVQQFAAEYGLPMPEMPANPSGHVGPRKRTTKRQRA